MIVPANRIHTFTHILSQRPGLPHDCQPACWQALQQVKGLRKLLRHQQKQLCMCSKHNGTEARSAPTNHTDNYTAA
jgi:hypothetical protein